MQLATRFWRLARHLDIALFLSASLVAALGVFMVYSVTKANPLLPPGSAHSYAFKQALFVVAGLLAVFAVLSLDYRYLLALSPILYGLNLVALLAVRATPAHLGSQRWFQIGPIQLQPSEFSLVTTTLVLAWWFTRRSGTPGLRETAVGLALAAAPMGLVYIQPDLGTAIILGAVTLSTFLAAGVPARYIMAMILAVALAGFAVIKMGVLHSYQTARLTAFLHPNSSHSSASYNLMQSEAAIGSGGLLGAGYGKGPETNLSYVPEVQTDFIFSAVGEQLGFLGSVGLLSLYGVMVWRIIRTVSLARDAAGRIVAGGVLGMIGFSVFENTGMTVGITPIAGVPLPFMSYGGSATVAFFIAVGLVLSVAMRRFSLKPRFG